MAKANPKNLGIDWRQAVGHAIGRAVDDLGWTRKYAAGRVGVGEPEFNKWINGCDRNRPQFDRLFAVPELRGPLAIALCRLAESVVIETVVRLPRLERRQA